MCDFKNALKDKVKSIIRTWNEDGIYAISFFVYSNESYEYNGYSNVVNFAVSYNTESDCPGAGRYDEERWNYAFWRQNETPIIYTDEKNPLTDMLFGWYKERGIENIGFESDDMYDENYNYIGKGPVGHYEFLSLVSEIASELQREGFISSRFGHRIPIIIHGLEYAWYDIEATKKGNPNEEAAAFLNALKELGFIK
jgi:hypothetical protein